MKITRSIFTLIAILLLLYLLINSFKTQHEQYYASTGSYIFAEGNAPDSVRSEIIHQLNAFQKGYDKRDSSLVQSFMEELFSKDNTMILGTMPKEIYVGYDEASALIADDWESWGDCNFLMDNASISSHQNVAWFSTIGYVMFDLSSLLVVPLRLSGTLVHENEVWKFQQLQFQFDLDLSFVLITIMLLLIWLVIATATLVVNLISSLRTRNT